MEVNIKITLADSEWGEYKNIHPELFLEDLFDGWQKDGVKKVEIIDIK